MSSTMTTDQHKANLRDLVEQLKAKDWNALAVKYSGQILPAAERQRYDQSCAFLDRWLAVACAELDVIDAKTKALANSQAAMQAALDSGDRAEAERIAAEIFPQLAADMLAQH